MAASATLRHRPPPPPHKALSIALEASLTPEAALRRVAAACLAQLDANTPGALLPCAPAVPATTQPAFRANRPGTADNAEYVHQMRVALRRLRCALRFFDVPAARRVRKQFGAALCRLARTLGGQRNWDVFISTLLPQCGLPPAALDLARQRALQLRGAAHQRVCDRMVAPAHVRLLHDFQRWLSDPVTVSTDHSAPLPAPRAVENAAEKSVLKQAARKGLARLQRRIKRGAKRFLTMPDAARHGVRIDVKRLRYAVNDTGVLFDAKTVKRCTTALTALQQLLGDLTDINMARIMLRRLGLDQPVLAAALSVLQEREAALLVKAPARFAAVLASKKIWKHADSVARHPSLTGAKPQTMGITNATSISQNTEDTMFEAAELGHQVSKEEYAAREPKLREALLKAQYDLLANGKFPVVIIIGGVDGAGKGETVNLLNEWMDPRHIVTHAFGEPSDEEAERPPMWRFWRALPPKGRIGVLFGSWYTAPIVSRVLKQTKSTELMQSIEEIRHFESMLTAEGVLLLKFWFHLSKDAQKKRLKALEKDPKLRWRVTDTDWQRFKIYDRFRSVSEDFLRETSSGELPWQIIEGADPNYRYLTAGTLLLEAVNQRLAGKAVRQSVAAAPLNPVERQDGRNLLNTLDYKQALPKKEYDKALEKYQGRLNALSRDPRFAGKSLICVFEGQDAAGKGSSIRRITGALDARHYRVIPVAAPTEEERAQPYLWRFWRHLPRHGRVTIFDRSWYGRVLVERVENFCPESDWMRAYHEINDFEEQLVRNNVILVKFWVAITKDEQLRRFNERKKIAFKNFKITEEDWRNRKKWSGYERAVCDMVERTSTGVAPWNVIPANDKLFGRISILKTLCQRLEQAL